MAKKPSLQLTDDRILVRTPEPVEESVGGIVLPKTATRLSPQILSEVIAVGPGAVRLFADGRRPLPCEVGDTVVHEFPGHPFDLDGETLKMLREADIIAVQK